MRSGKGWIIVLALVVVGAVVLGLTQKQSAPSVQGTDLAGQPFSLEAWRGRPVLVDFWATTCPGCVQEMPRLVAFWRQQHAQGFELVAVAMSYDDAAQVRRFAAERQLPFTVVVDRQGTIAHAFGDIHLTPTAFLIDAQGHIVQQIIGDPDFADLAKRVAASRA